MATITRRTALGSLGSLLGLGLSGTLALVPAEAKKHKHKKKRRRRTGETPTPLPTPTPPVPGDPDPGTCPAGSFGIEGRCVVGCDTGCVGGGCFTDNEGTVFCGAPIVSCAAIPHECGSSADCGAQEVCAQTICESAATNPNRTRCVPILV